MSRLDNVGFRYCLSVGNQIDLTLGDYLDFLADDPKLDLYAVYAEGFAPGDGLRFLEAAQRARARGATVLLYRAGRTESGARAATSHTAAVAGSYTITRALAEQAGVVVADTLEDFQDQIRLFALLGPPPACQRVAVMSNAGFESVAAADNLAYLRTAELAPATLDALTALLDESGLSDIVSAGNPLDVTPILGDLGFAQAARLVLEDPAVDTAVIGCVPLTPALETLEPGTDHAEDLHRTHAVGPALAELRRQTRKPWVVAIDAGGLYRPLAELLGAHGIPVFDTIDRATRLLETYCRAGGRVE